MIMLTLILIILSPVLLWLACVVIMWTWITFVMLPYAWIWSLFHPKGRSKYPVAQIEAANRSEWQAMSDVERTAWAKRTVEALLR